MKNKVRKISIRFKILIPSMLITLLLCAALGISSYLSTKDSLINVGSDAAFMAAELIASTTDGDGIAALTPADNGGERYNKYLSSLNKKKDESGLAYVYTLYTDGSKVYYGIDTDLSGEHSSYGDEYEESYSRLKTAFEGKNLVIKELDDNNLITVYIPLTGFGGNTVGVLGADYDATAIADELKTVITRTLIIAGACLLVAIIVLNIIVASIMKGLKNVDGKIYDIVHNEGDLTQKLEVKSGDELERIADNVNSLLEYIRGIMLNISNNAGNLGESTQTVVANIGNARASLDDVSATMQQMSASMEETNASMNRITESINDASVTLGEIYEDAESGKRSASEVMTRAQNVYENAVSEQNEAKDKAARMAENVSARIEESKAVQEIDELTQNIIAITQQTNLLSLNASIEAARAGEAGRGFAVVADEIGKLAADSGRAAEQIKTVSDSVIHAVDALAKEANAMLTFLDEITMAGYSKLLETCDSYKSDVGDMSALMQRFARESENLKKEMTLILEATNAINTAVDESTLGITNVTEMSVELSNNMTTIDDEVKGNLNVAGTLNEEVGRFKL